MQTENNNNTSKVKDAQAENLRAEKQMRDIEAAEKQAKIDGGLMAPESEPVIASIPGVTPGTTDPFDASTGELALEKILGNLHGIPLSAVRKRHITGPSLVSLGLCYARNYKEDRSYFEEAFKPSVFDVNSFDDMYERAMAYWHLSIIVRQNANGSLTELLAEAKPLRGKLLRAAIYLWGEDPRLGPIVADVRSGHAYLNQADDMGALAKLFMDNWGSADGKCEITREDIFQAQSLGARFMEAMGSEKTEALSEHKELHLQSEEYLRRGIEKVQAAANFVFNGDEQRLSRYPRFYAMRRKRKNGNGEASGQGTEAEHQAQETEEQTSQSSSPVSEVGDQVSHVLSATE